MNFQNRILYQSTNQKLPEVENLDPVTFREALFNGIAPDGGLYMPTFIPQISKGLLEKISKSKSYSKVALEILKNFLKDEIELMMPTIFLFHLSNWMIQPSFCGLIKDPLLRSRISPQGLWQEP